MRQPPTVVWDVKSAREFPCDIISAEASKTGVVISYGAIRGDRFVSVNLEGRIELPPETAKNLRDLLVRLIADADALGGNTPESQATAPFDTRVSEVRR